MHVQARRYLPDDLKQCKRCGKNRDEHYGADRDYCDAVYRGPAASDKTHTLCPCGKYLEEHQLPDRLCYHNNFALVSFQSKVPPRLAPSLFGCALSSFVTASVLSQPPPSPSCIMGDHLTKARLIQRDAFESEGWNSFLKIFSEVSV